MRNSDWIAQFSTPFKIEGGLQICLCGKPVKEISDTGCATEGLLGCVVKIFLSRDLKGTFEAHISELSDSSFWKLIFGSVRGRSSNLFYNVYELEILDLSNKEQ